MLYTRSNAPKHPTGVLYFLSASLLSRIMACCWTEHVRGRRREWDTSLNSEVCTARRRYQMSISHEKRYRTIWFIPCSPNRAGFCENSPDVDNNFRHKIALPNAVSFSACFHIPLATIFKQCFCIKKYRDPEIPKAWISGFGINTIPGSRDPDPGDGLSALDLRANEHELHQELHALNGYGQFWQW